MLHIGISGNIGAGKSTLATALYNKMFQHGLRAKIIPFATGVKEIAAMETHAMRLASMTKYFYTRGYEYPICVKAARAIDQCMEACPSTPGIKNRRLLQFIGTDAGREMIDEHIWIYAVQQCIPDELDYIISDDLRFDNEAMAVDVHIGITIPLDKEHAYELRCRELGEAYTYSDHSSERSLSLPALFNVTFGFTDEHVQALFDLLERVRMLRGSA